MSSKIVFIFLVILHCKISALVYLSYHDDPTSSITVYYHASTQELAPVLRLRLQGDGLWTEALPRRIDRKEISLTIFRYDIQGLKAGSKYEFGLEGNQRVYHFKTLPQNLSSDAVRFIVGGDAYRSISSFRKMNETIRSLDPDFVVLAGDIAYTQGTPTLLKGKLWEIKRFHTFLSEYLESVHGKDGRLVPIVVAVGNHDVSKKNKEVRPLLFDLFPLDAGVNSYRVLDLAGYLSLFLLDTGHLAPIEGEQTTWLQRELEARDPVPYKIPVYHVSAYPSVYSMSSKVSTKIRVHWAPLFEKHGVRLAFEHHNHAYKRTYPMKAEKIDPKGVVYIGDGCWGVPPRPPTKAWYLEKKMRKNCINLVELTKEKEKVLVYGLYGDVIDFYEKKAQEP